MFILYVVLVIALGNSSLILSMNSYTPFIIPYNQSALNFRQSLNPDNYKVTIELNSLKAQQQQERKQSLTKSIESVSSNFKYGLYNKVSCFLNCQSPHYEGLIECINGCNYIKRFGVNEDEMGRFSFCRDNMTRNQKTSLFFYLLKYYNKHAAAAREIPPKIWSPLAKKLNLVNNDCNIIEILINDVNSLLLHTIPHYNEFVSFIHSNHKFCDLSDDFVTFNSDWQKKFVHDAFAMLYLNDPHNALYDIVILVSEAKQAQLIQTEIDLGYYVLSYDPIGLDRLEMGLFTTSYDQAQKGKIALLCSCIEKYNEARGKKITPSVKLYRIYEASKPLHILLPEAFDKELLDPEKIAFAEYAELLDAIDELRDAYDEAVEDCIKMQYPEQLSTAIDF
jgi:hypothetical protein